MSRTALSAETRPPSVERLLAHEAAAASAEAYGRTALTEEIRAVLAAIREGHEPLAESEELIARAEARLAGTPETVRPTEPAEADAAADKPAPWEMPGQRDGGRMSALPKAGFELAQAAAQVGRTGSPEQVQQAVEILDEARRRLYALLAQD